MRFFEEGIGRPIVLIHGWPAGASIWRGQLDRLGTRHHVLAPDLPGFGGSPAAGAQSCRDAAAAIRSFIEAMHLEKVVLVGWSVGARVALAYCRAFGVMHLRGLAL